MRQSDVPLPMPPGGDRPSEGWVCGNARFGTPCPCGPLPNGKCPAEGLCRPTSNTSQSGPGYQCSRPKCLGGPCEMGPEPDGLCGMIPKPCIPVRSSMGRRRALVRWALAASVGLLLIAIGGSWSREIFAPGHLIESHALILGGERREDRCAACHPAARGRMAQWFGSGQVGHANVSQSDLCMDCHHAKLDRNKATLPHNLRQDELRQAFQSLQFPQQKVRSVSFNLSAAVNDIECSACHREHHGKDADLTLMSNQQCQTCHSIRFESFAVGHPQWEEWPYGRGGTVAFNHSSHQFNHFNQKGIAFDCRTCHQLDLSGEVSRSGSFETMCASCHQQPLELKVVEGFSMLSLPTLDGDSIAQSNLALGPWPEAALGVDRFEIPEFTQALLSNDPEASKAIAQLSDPKLTNLAEPLSEDSLKASVKVADALRKLLDGLARDPNAEMQSRFGSEEAGKVLGQLPPQLTAAAIDAWFVESATNSGQKLDARQMLPNGGWYRDDLRSAIRYRGTGHADSQIKLLAEFTTEDRLTAKQRDHIAAIPAVQACLECHPKPNAHLANSWRSIRTDFNMRLFTKFSHRPHMNLPQLIDCTFCHDVRQPGAMEQGLVKVASYQQSDDLHHATNQGPKSSQDVTSVRVNDFRDLRKSACLGCHIPEAAGDSCTKCHNYHVGSLK